MSLTSFKNAFKEKKVLVTGHTGFKGSWLSLWLKKMGSEVIGYSLQPATSPNLFTLASVDNHVDHHTGDIRDVNRLTQVIQSTEPEIIFHLAAQSIVLEGYHSPQETFATNTLGTVNVLEACRQSSSIKAVVIVTTDKCYENRSWLWGYRENDRLGGKDPYSASKAMAELAVSAYHASFFKNQIPVATMRCGNVIGGGDFSNHRLLPDCFRALIQNNPILIRNPQSVRPWLHVFDSLYGYLILAERMLSEKEAFSGSWNLGPQEKNAITVQEMVDYTIQKWGSGSWTEKRMPDAPNEMGILKLNWEKASHELHWKPQYDWKQAISETVAWYKAYMNNADIYETCMLQIENYEHHTYPAE